jgi:glutathione S-transferase
VIVNSELPVLYSFRRCPYAIRARIAVYRSAIPVELREVVLRDMPSGLLEASPKGTVPVLVLPNGEVIDESWDIVQWALGRNDPDNWLGTDAIHLDRAEPLIKLNDFDFKEKLDRYKYPDRFPEHPQTYYRDWGEAYLQALEARLVASPYLLGDMLTVADIGIFPFIRQFAFVDRDWFDKAPYPRLRSWLDALLKSMLFTAVMDKYPVWKAGDPPLVFSGYGGEWRLCRGNLNCG